MKRTGPINPVTRKIVRELEKSSVKYKAKIWKRVADDIKRPRRIRRAVNIGRLERYCKEGETVVVPGKLLGGGRLTKKLVVASLEASESAKKKVEMAGGKWMSLGELIKKNPEGRNIRLVG